MMARMFSPISAPLRTAHEMTTGRRVETRIRIQASLEQNLATTNIALIDQDDSHLHKDEKHFEKIHEFIVPYSVIKQMRGDLTAAEVLDFHKRIAECSEGVAGAKVARAIRDEILQAIKGHTGIMRFDFKIDDFKQRRLQLSVRLSDLIAAVSGKVDYCANGHSQLLHTVHDTKFCQYKLPFIILSPGRKIVTVAGEELYENEEDVFLFDDAPLLEAPTSSFKRVTVRKVPQRQDKLRILNKKGMDKDLQRALFG